MIGKIKGATELVSERGMRTFILVWTGQFVSLIGSGLTWFGLGVWVWQETGSVTQFALIAVSASVPATVFSPFAGALVDRWDRRRAMILSDTGAAAMTVIIAVLFYFNSLEVWHIYIAVAIGAMFGSLQWPAYSAATTVLVPKRHLARAAGMVQTAQAISQTLSPLIAGALIGLIQLWGILAIDFITFLFALLTLALIQIPRPKVSAAGEEGRGSLWKEAAFGWKYIRSRHGLFVLLWFFAGVNFSLAFFGVLNTPMILSFSTPQVLGAIRSVGGLGMIIGGLALSTWGGPTRRVYGVIGSGAILGVGVIVYGLRPSIPLIIAAEVIIMVVMPIANGCSQAIWQVKTPPDIQGKVFSVRRMIAGSMTPISFLLAGPLADRIFEPLMAVDGAWAESMGKIIGVGPGRGIGLMLVIVGTLVILTAVISFLYPRLRYLEDEIPDMVDE